MDNMREKFLMFLKVGCISMIGIGIFAIICSISPAIGEILVYIALIAVLILYYLVFIKPY